jgi:hypothetical protein
VLLPFSALCETAARDASSRKPRRAFQRTTPKIIDEKMAIADGV